jgi:hypothetical protein
VLKDVAVATDNGRLRQHSGRLDWCRHHMPLAEALRAALKLAGDFDVADAGPRCVCEEGVEAIGKRE